MQKLEYRIHILEEGVVQDPVRHGTGDELAQQSGHLGDIKNQVLGAVHQLLKACSKAGC